MMYHDFAAGGNEYKLRISTRNVVMLEKQLGCNPLMIFTEGEMPTTTAMLQVLHASLQEMHHGITMDKVYTIFDEYLADGHTPADFLGVLVDIYKVSGLIASGEVEGKN